MFPARSWQMHSPVSLRTTHSWNCALSEIPAPCVTKHDGMTPVASSLICPNLSAPNQKPMRGCWRAQLSLISTRSDGVTNCRFDVTETRDAIEFMLFPSHQPHQRSHHIAVAKNALLRANKLRRTRHGIHHSRRTDTQGLRCPHEWVLAEERQLQAGLVRSRLGPFEEEFHCFSCLILSPLLVVVSVPI